MSLPSTGGTADGLLPDAMTDHLRGGLARVAGVALGLVAIAGWLSLLTWSASDPSLSRVTGAPVANMLGPIGAIISDFMLQAFGLAAVFVFLPPFAWAIVLTLKEWLARPRLKVLFCIIAVSTLAAACSAMPTAQSWPLDHGLGGFVGDGLFGLASGLLANLNAENAGAAAGLMFFFSGIVALGWCLGLSQHDIAVVFERDPGARIWTAKGPWLPGLQPRFPNSNDHQTPIDETAYAARPAPHGLHSGEPRADDTIDASLATPGSLRDRLAQSHSRPDPGIATPPVGGTSASFDTTTDDDSRAMAKRFAPSTPSPPPTVTTQHSMAFSSAARTANDLIGTLKNLSAPVETTYRRPSLNLLKRPTSAKPGRQFAQSALRGNARLLQDVLADFGVQGEIRNIRPGPVVTLFELEPARGTKSSRIIGLADDIARSMSAVSARIAIVPGQNVIGIELPNTQRETFGLRELLETNAYGASDAALPLALGKSISGEPFVVDLARMPHLLVAGTTGSGKSVGINAMLLSLLYQRSPDECRLLLIDPKMLELSVYNNIPHLLTPVVTDPHKAVIALQWAVSEMEERYKRMAKLGVRNLEVFNNRVRNASKHGKSLNKTVHTGFDGHTGEAIYETVDLDFEPMPHIVIVVDEFADLMIAAGKEIEAAVQRLAQMARAAGIHLIMATQRPSVDVITGTIKANFPTRISYKLISKTDSRTILNEQGAEQLLGHGDMLYSSGSGHPVRVHGPFVTDDEVEQVTAYLRSQGGPRYISAVTEAPISTAADQATPGEEDEHYERAVAIVLRDQRVSTSYLQRCLQIGYNRAARLVERMEAVGIVSPPDDGGRRHVIASDPPFADDLD